MPSRKWREKLYIVVKDYFSKKFMGWSVLEGLWKGGVRVGYSSTDIWSESQLSACAYAMHDQKSESVNMP